MSSVHFLDGNARNAELGYGAFELESYRLVSAVTYTNIF